WPPAVATSFVVLRRFARPAASRRRGRLRKRAACFVVKDQQRAKSSRLIRGRAARVARPSTFPSHVPVPEGELDIPFAYSALMPADLKTLPHFSVSLATNLPNSAGVIDTGKVPS